MKYPERTHSKLRCPSTGYCWRDGRHKCVVALSCFENTKTCTFGTYPRKEQSQRMEKTRNDWLCRNGTNYILYRRSNYFWISQFGEVVLIKKVCFE